MNIFKKETPKPEWTQYYKLNPLGENIPVYIENGIQITHIMADNRPVEVRLSVPEKDDHNAPQEPMRRFRVYDKWLHETLEQSDTNDYSYRDKENMWICDITDALEDPTRFVVQENTGILDIFDRYIFEGDKVSFNEEICGHALVRTGVVTRSETGMWLLMVDVTIPFGLYHIKDRVILGHINEGV